MRTPISIKKHHHIPLRKHNALVEIGITDSPNKFFFLPSFALLDILRGIVGLELSFFPFLNKVKYVFILEVTFVLISPESSVEIDNADRRQIFVRNQHEFSQLELVLPCDVSDYELQSRFLRSKQRQVLLKVFGGVIVPISE